jgi:hydrogenase-4 component B
MAILISIAILLVSGVVCLGIGRKGALAGRIGSAGTVAACVLGLIPALTILLTGTTVRMEWAWSIPGGSLRMQIDGLSAFFLVPILLICGLGAIYGRGYLHAHEGRRNLGPVWFFYALLTAAMILVVIADNAILFLMAWEIMSLASFALVMFDGDDPAVRQAGWTYLIAMHLGTAFLLVMFLLLAGDGSLNFDQLHCLPRQTLLIFLLAVIGFGTKAGFMPLHVWLPEAHPAAPSHVSAVMSGVMIKTGIYGLLRTLGFLETLPQSLGWILIGIGMASGILGILFALAQNDIKRMLAYSSIENIGIIAIGIGLGILGLSRKIPPLAILGFSGALLHTLNHSLFKSVLFFGAGSVAHATGTRQMDRLGGLIGVMPWTAKAFLVGAVAICGLVPLNGFAGEFLMYLGALQIPRPALGAFGIGLGAIGSLALIGGLAVACFTKVFGIVFLGQPRQIPLDGVHEVGPAMRTAMAIPAILCILIGLVSPWILPLLEPAIGILTGWPVATLQEPLRLAGSSLAMISGIGLIFWLVILLLALLRRAILKRRPVDSSVTWDCGYAAPAARMQYTATSFSGPLTTVFGLLIQSRSQRRLPSGLFSRQVSVETQTPDLFQRFFYTPVFIALVWFSRAVRRLQHGRVHLYILYIVLTLLALILWSLA